MAVSFAVSSQGYFSDLNNIARIVTLVPGLVSWFRIKFPFGITFCTQVFYITKVKGEE